MNAPDPSNQSMFEGWYKFILAQAMLQYALFPPSALAAIGELVDNSYDAGATTVWVILELVDGSLVVRVIDNGNGMIDVMSPEDQAKINSFISDIASRRFRSGTKVREYISGPSRSSLEWLSKMIAFSGKLPNNGPLKRGLRGLGFQGFRQLANRLVMVTRPSPTLAKLAWANDPIRINNPPTFYYLPPTVEMLHNMDPSWVIEPSNIQLVDPYGKALPHGTMIELREIRAGIETSLRIPALIESLRTSFGDPIRQKKISIRVIDRFSEEGRRHLGGGGLENVVPAARFSGIELIRGVFKTRRDEFFDVELRYDPRGRGLEPTYRRGDADKGSLNALAAFKGHPALRTGKLNGYVQFPPDVPDHEAPWNGDKSVPLESPTRNRWEERVLQILSEVMDKITEIEGRAKDAHLQSRMSKVSTAAQQAIQELDSFQGLVVGPIGEDEKEKTTRKKGQKGKPRKKYTPRQMTVATVKDEYNRPLPKIWVELWKNEDFLQSSDTGSSGTAGFGELEVGQYRLVLAQPLPDGVRLAKGSVAEYRFHISSNQPHFRAQFQLATGAPPPRESKLLNQITVVPMGLSDPNQPYSADRLRVGGVIEINSLFPPYAQAVEENNLTKIDHLTAGFVSAALTQVATEAGGDISQTLLQQSSLFGIILTILDNSK